MAHPEDTTIKAINELKDNYPYAASLLTYVVIERELITLLLNRGLDKKTVFGLTLGKIEQRLGIKNGPAKDRNDMVHSRLYVKGEKELPYGKRVLANKNHFDKAKKHLIKIFKKYSLHEVIEDKGNITLSLK